MSRRNTDQQLARALQAEHGCSYTTALNRVRDALTRLRAEGVSPVDARDRIAIMTAAELGIAPRAVRS